MGLRGVCIIPPLLGATHLKNQISPTGAVIALTVRLITVLMREIDNPYGVDPLYVGLLSGFAVLFLPYL